MARRLQSTIESRVYRAEQYCQVLHDLRGASTEEIEAAHSKIICFSVSTDKSPQEALASLAMTMLKYLVNA